MHYKLTKPDMRTWRHYPIVPLFAYMSRDPVPTQLELFEGGLVRLDRWKKSRQARRSDEGDAGGNAA
jgi:hypothetical protein